MHGGVPGSSAVRSYDIRDEHDMIALLKEVRHSTLDPETKDDVRDVVFEYSTHPDETLIAELQLYLEPLGIKLATAPASNSLPSVPTAEPTSPAVPETPKTSRPAQTHQGRPVPQGFGVRRPTTIASTSKPVSESTPVSTSVPAPEPALKVETQPPVATPPPALEPEPAVTPAETPVAATSSDSAQERIATIKHTVNAAVGNPVNLIDANNAVGREYMTALLEAMKAVPAGGADLATAMTRLEHAFAAVEKILPAVAEGNTEAATPAPVPPAPATPAPSAVAEASIAPVSTPTSPEPDTEPAAAPEPSPSVWSQQTQSDTTPAPTASVAHMAVLKQKEEPKPVTSESTDPFMTEEVTSGLSQLLNEWKLFKSSGLFGTGPHGINHPLYQKMRSLQMNLIVTGRFEGATPEVRQSLIDYMNGWRYEQGMTHDMQETFEHYLRRIIRAIIDKRTREVA